MTPKKRARIAASIFVGVCALVIYASCVEPRWLEVTHHDVALPVQAPLTIAHVSDLHIRSVGALEEATLAAIAAARPDLIVITGDLYSNEAALPAADEFLARLARSAP